MDDLKKKLNEYRNQSEASDNGTEDAMGCGCLSICNLNDCFDYCCCCDNCCPGCCG